MNHKQLITLGQSLGYNAISQKGLCNGFSHMWIQAACNGVLPAFNKRMKLLDEFSVRPDTLLIEIERIRGMVKQIKGGNAEERALTIERRLSDREKELLEIPSFFEGVSLYQNPAGSVSGLFNAPISQRETSKISQYTQSQSATEGLTQSKTIVDQYNPEELSTHLHFLARELEGKPNVAINFRSSNHSVAARYLGDNQFEFIDTNFVPGAAATISAKTLNSTELGNALREAFKSSRRDGQDMLMTTELLSSQAEQLEHFRRMDLVQEITELNADATGSSLLHIAVVNSDKELIESIDLNQVDVNKSDGMGVSNLTRSIQAIAFNKSTDSEAIFDKLMSTASINVNHEDSNADFPISQAIFYDDWERANRMVAHPTFNAQATDKEGTTYLHSAANKKGTQALSMAKLLIDHGANVNARDMNGNTPLTDACFNGNSDLVKLLLEKGANANMRTYNGFTPLDVACARQSRDVIAVVLPHTKLTMDNLRPESPMLKAMQSCPKETQLMFVKKALETYIETREKNKTRTRDILSVIGAGYSQSDKIGAAKKLLNQIDHPGHGKLDAATLRILGQGRLGTIYNFYDQSRLGVTESMASSKACEPFLLSKPPSSIIIPQKQFIAAFAELREQESVKKMRPAEVEEENQTKATHGRMP